MAGKVTEMLNLKEDNTLKKLGLYNVGETVTCFVKKVRSESYKEMCWMGQQVGMTSKGLIQT